MEDSGQAPTSFGRIASLGTLATGHAEQFICICPCHSFLVHHFVPHHSDFCSMFLGGTDLLNCLKLLLSYLVLVAQNGDFQHVLAATAVVAIIQTMRVRKLAISQT